MIPVVSLNSCLCYSYLVLFMKTLNANIMSESESWTCHQCGLCSGVFAYCANGLLCWFAGKSKKTFAVFA